MSLARSVLSLNKRFYVAPSAALLQKDILSDIALGVVRAYKPAQEKPTDPQLNKPFSPPAAPVVPKAPELSAAELEAYSKSDDVFDAVKQK
ncbi:hypothetical protein RI367_004011 [Sorochytrium milnesiophthora]